MNAKLAVRTIPSVQHPVRPRADVVITVPRVSSLTLTEKRS
jgi:hypothetical protein